MHSNIPNVFICFGIKTRHFKKISYNKLTISVKYIHLSFNHNTIIFLFTFSYLNNQINVESYPYLIHHSSLHIPNSRITVGRDPHSSKVVGVDFVLYELTPPILMDIDPARLTVVDFTSDHGGVGSRLHLKPCYPVVVNIIFLKVTLKLK